MFALQMLRAIGLDYQSSTRAVKIDNEIHQWLLSIEPHSMQSLSSQLPPERLLGTRHVASQISGQFLQILPI
jgi:kynurenine formamidase